MSEPCPDPPFDIRAAGRMEAMSALYDRFGQRLYRTAWGMLGRQQDAEDAVHDVFVELVRSRVNLDEIDDMTAYLFTALRRAVGRLTKLRSKEPSISDEAVQLAAACSADAESSDVRSERLEWALGMLPRKQREVIAMKIDGDLTFAQIAIATGVSINTVASRYRYALEKLRALLHGRS